MRDGKTTEPEERFIPVTKTRSRLSGKSLPVYTVEKHIGLDCTGIVPKTLVIEKPSFHFADTAVCIIFAHSNVNS